MWASLLRMLASLAPYLLELHLEWVGSASVDPAWVNAMTSLRILTVEAHSVVVPQALTALSHLTSLRLMAGAGSCDLQHCAALPSSLETMSLSWEAPATPVPACVTALPRLRKLQLSSSRVAGGLEGVEQLTALQELALNECQLAAVPTQLSTLTALQVRARAVLLFSVAAGRFMHTTSRSCWKTRPRCQCRPSPSTPTPSTWTSCASRWMCCSSPCSSCGCWASARSTSGGLEAVPGSH